MNRGTSRRVLNSTHLRVFDTDAKKIILRAMKLGATGKINTNGHAWIYAPNGMTMSVSRDTSAPNCLKNVEADFKRCFPEESSAPLTKESNKPMHTDTRVAFTDVEPATAPINGNGNGVAAVAPKDDMIACPAKGCDKEFVTEGAKLRHVSDNHYTCEWKGPDVEHDDPSYSCDWGAGSKSFVGLTKTSLGGHVNVRHRGSKPWEHRNPAKRSEVAKKAAATRAAVKAGTSVAEHKATVAKGKEDAPKLHDVHGHPAVVAPVQPEHRALPTGKDKPLTDAAKLQAIRNFMGGLLGEDPRIALLQAANAKLQAKVDDLQAQLDLVAEALHINAPKKN